MQTINELKKQFDTAGMDIAISGCPDQITYMLSTHADWPLPDAEFKPAQVLYLGMGGSAIGGDIVRIWATQLGKMPMIVNRDYRIQAWVNRQTLVIASSYSGNTEETLESVAKAAGHGCRA